MKTGAETQKRRNSESRPSLPRSCLRPGCVGLGCRVLAGLRHVPAMGQTLRSTLLGEEGHRCGAPHVGDAPRCRPSDGKRKAAGGEPGRQGTGKIGGHPKESPSCFSAAGRCGVHRLNFIVLAGVDGRERAPGVGAPPRLPVSYRCNRSAACFTVFRGSSASARWSRPSSVIM